MLTFRGRGQGQGVTVPLPSQPYYPGMRNADWSITPIYNENALPMMRVRNTGNGQVPHVQVPAVSQLRYFDRDASSAIGGKGRKGRKGKPRSKRGMGKRMSLAVRPPAFMGANEPPINFAAPPSHMTSHMSQTSTAVGMGRSSHTMHQQQVKRGGSYQGLNAYGAVVTPNIIPW